ncbi:putative Ig domain-containing protein [Carboxylicivirga linearis]|uniref:T9SS type A sorting domain-containing protein n=1 Tax=Carboxylicivirga linearis TaxID=1628157 RepID=A0ABS5JSC3_9BACT|nr:putative Ig domain-containing protein [Carboxylicivirga linearis]MBS2097286.1 hypothetical protein [Carboxylicivirga linearis]
MKKFYRELFIGLWILFMISNQAYSQISFGGTPPSFIKGKALPEINNIQVNLNVEKLKAENLLRKKESNNPPCIARAIPVSFDMENSGEWTQLGNGGEMWQLRLKAEGALAILLSYDDFYIPESAELYIYNADRTHVLGAYTNATHPKSGAFSTEMVVGDDIIIEYVSTNNHKVLLDNGNFDGIPVISIDNIGYVFDNVVIKHLPRATVNTEIGGSEACMININCSEGNDWQTEKNGVCQMTMYISTGSAPGWYVCSGDLINNTAQDLTPYVISAFHCYEGATTEDLARWQFMFGYESPGCEDEEPLQTYTITGCYLRVASPIDGGSDGLLVELADDIPAEWGVYYNGWDRRNEVNPGVGVGIHHPAGDIKKISTFETYETGTWPGEVTGATDAHWNLQFVATENGHSVTEGGSSGSSLFDSNHLIIGTLTGGNSSCANSIGSNYYGKLWYHWDQFGTDATTQMKTWLDPLNLGVETLAGTAFNPTSPRISFDSQNVTVEGTTNLGGAGPATTISIEGHNLDNEITASIEGNFEISLDGVNWTQSANLPKEGGLLYVHFIPTVIGHSTGRITLSNDLTSDYYINTKASSCPDVTFENAVLTPATYDEFYSSVITVLNATTEVINYEITEGQLPLGIELKQLTGEISGIPMESGVFTFTLVVTDDNGCFVTANFELDVQCKPFSSFPYTESFEYGFPSCWSQEYETGSVGWVNQTGGYAGNENPDKAFDGAFNMVFRSENYEGNTTYLVTPQFDISLLTNPVLSFAHAQVSWEGDQDILTVNYKISADGEWKQLATYTKEIPEWKIENIPLPELSSELFIGFKAEANYAYGVVLDKIIVGSPSIISQKETVLLSDFNLINNQPVAEIGIDASLLSEDITVTCSAPFAVSSDNINWGSSCQLSKDGGILYITYDTESQISSESEILLQSTATEITIKISDGMTGVDDIANEGSSIKALSPFSNELTLTWSLPFSDIEITDLSGRSVYSSASILGMKSINIPTGSWGSGLYCIKMKGDETVDQVIKVFKK